MTETQPQNLKGIGGWLALFLVSILYQTIIRIQETIPFVQVLLRNDALRVTAVLTIVCLEAISLVLGIVVFVLLIKAQRRGITWVWVWMSSLLGLRVYMAWAWWVNNGTLNDSLVAHVIQQLAYSLVWMAYFLQSERVKQTYFSGQQ